MHDGEEYLDFLYRNYTESIRAADQKVFLLVSIALAIVIFIREEIPSVAIFAESFAVVVHAFLLAETTSWPTVLRACAALLSFVFTFAGVLIGLLVMRPSTKSSHKDQIFWGNIARMKRDDFIQNAEKRTSVSDCGLAANVHDLAVILRGKHRNIAIMVSLVFCMTFFTLIYIVAS